MTKPIYLSGRRDIAHRHIWVRLWESPSGRPTPPQFEHRIDLAGYGLPDEAEIIVEAYHSAYYQRFSCGTVGIPDHSRRRLELAPGDRPLFRIKVRDNGGKLLAAADEVRPETDDSIGAGGSLLPIRPQSRGSMGELFWRVHFVAAGAREVPELHVNMDVPGFYADLTNRVPYVTGLVMPAVLRQVLQKLVDEQQEWDEDEPWLSFAWSLYHEEFEVWDRGDPRETRRLRHDWVDRVVSAFAKLHCFLSDLEEQRNAGHSNGGDSDA